MHQAILEADLEKIQELIHEIEPHYPKLGQKLAELAYNFDYDGIRALIEELVKEYIVG